MNIPTLFLRFPIQQANGAVQPALNEIAIDVDTQQCDGWAVEIDWGVISVRPALNYGLFFIHGWTGDEGTFQYFNTLAEQDEYQTYQLINYKDGIQSLDDTASSLRQEIIITATTVYTGVDKVFVVAHSRGGLFTRAALRTYPELASKIAGYITLSTPHHGSDYPDDFLSDDLGIPLVSGHINQCKSVSTADACKAAAQSLRKEEVRRFNYGEQCHEQWIWWEWPLRYGWVDCLPQWNEAESAHAFAVVGSQFPEVDAESATFPWHADKIPFPATPNVDFTFPVDHTGITSSDDVYEYIINLFSSSMDVHCGEASAASASSNSPESQLLTPTITGTLTAGQVQSVTVPVEAVTTAGFVVTGDAPLTVTLLTPAGQIIDPTTPAVDPNVRYAAQDATTLWYYQYRVESPADGLWQIQIESEATTEFEALAVGASPLLVHLFADQGVYRPGETVSLETGVLAEPGTLHTGFAFSGTVQLPGGGAFPLTFHDDGVQGDKVAGDNLYTAQFTAPTANADLEIVVQAAKNNIVRIESLLVPVVAQTATLLGASNERALDTNGNGFFDALAIDVAVDVLEAGDYDVVGDLYDGCGEKLADGVFTTFAAGMPFATGVQTVTLTFDGKTLREAGVDGPYVLDHLAVDHHTDAFDFPMTVVSARQVYTTAAYTAGQFEGDALRVLTANERAADLTGDGLYDSLAISVTFDVLQPGVYEWHGVLVDGSGAQVAQTAHRGQLDRQTPALFTFAGGQVRQASLDGPYTLTNVFITRLGEPVETYYFDDVHRTAAYPASQFGTTPLVLTVGGQTALDANDNGLFDFLVITATVDAIVPEGDYDWSGRLTTPDGTELGVVTGGGQLYRGKSIELIFLGPPIRQAAIDDAYALRDLVITHRTMPAVTAVLPLVYTTPPFQATQFDAWNMTVAGTGARAVDLDANGLYDKLVFTTTLDIPLPGAYYLHYALVAQQAPDTVLLAIDWSWWYAQGQVTRVVSFSGLALADVGVDGPYTLKLVEALYYPNETESAVVLTGAQDLFTTAAYAASQFQ
ncbi:MAG: hypothetical protein IAE81_15510 [Caldilineaceae bacterium]|nr:hypothetical protein [Caldilineaceae bacterium]